MITRLILKNFQRHRRLAIDLQRVSSIVGSTDMGKSAIVRALRWICFNKPSGDGFRTHDSKSTSATIEIDGRTIARRRGKANAYELDGESMLAFGSDPPEPIQSVLNVSAANFQEQHDAPYWFSESAGQVGRDLNRIVDLDAIDSSLAWIDSESRKAKASKDASEERLAKSRAAAKELSWIDDADKSWKRIEILDAKNEADRRRISNLEKSMDELESLRRRSESLSMIVDAERDLESIRRVMEESKALADKIEILEESSASIRSLNLNIIELDALAGKLESELDRATKGRCPICQGKLPNLKSSHSC